MSSSTTSKLASSTSSRQLNRRNSLVPCTPKRPLSNLSSDSLSSSTSTSSLVPPPSVARYPTIARTQTPLSASVGPGSKPRSALRRPSLSGSTSLRPNPSSNANTNVTDANDQPSVKRYKAPLSSESKVRPSSAINRAKTPINNLDTPGSPRRNQLGSSVSRPQSRATTPLPNIPGSPRTPTGKRSQSVDVFSAGMMSEMDVTRVDPEAALVDWENVEADESGDMSLSEITGLREIGSTGGSGSTTSNGEREHSKEDKVLVSVRVRPTDNTLAWDVSPSLRSITLLPEFSKQVQASLAASTSSPTKSNGAGSPQEFVYDEVLTGSSNKEIYTRVARNYVTAAMEGYNSVVFAYGQTASGKTFTLTGDDNHPGITPLALKDIFTHIRRTPSREFLLRCSYLEIYNETIHDLLAPPSAPPVQISGSGDNVILSPLREEVVTSLKKAREVLERGYGGRRTASTDWNERSSRSHSVFRVVIESRERGGDIGDRGDSGNGRATPGPTLRPQTPGGTRLQSRGGRTVQSSVLSLIDLAGSEKATSDKDRTREGKYINTSLLTLGSVISMLAENAAKGKTSYVPFRNSKLTRLLQPSLSGNARISVICTMNPEPGAVTETLSTLGFARRVRGVKLNAQKKEVIDTEALLQRYKKEIEELKKRLEEKEKEASGPKKRRLSEREQLDESRAMNDLNSRIRQLTKLILTSQSVDDNAQSRPVSPTKLDFDASPFQLQQDLLSARRTIDTQATQILSLEAALQARPPVLPETASEKDQLIAEQAKTIRELEIVVAGYEENLGEPLRQVREDVEREWITKLEEEQKIREEKEVWAREVERELEREKGLRQKLEEERRALISFVTKFDALGPLGIPTRRQPSTVSSSSTSSHRKRSYTLALDAVPEAQDSPQKLDSTAMAAKAKGRIAALAMSEPSIDGGALDSPMKLDVAEARAAPCLLDQSWSAEDVDVDMSVSTIVDNGGVGIKEDMEVETPNSCSSVNGKGKESLLRHALEDKENVPLL